MKVFLAVLSLAAAAAAAGVPLDFPSEQVGKAVEQDPFTKLDASARMISLYSSPIATDAQKMHELGGMKKILEGPVTVAFKDSKEDKLNAFLLPYGFQELQKYKLDEVLPIVHFMINGRKKAFLYLSAGSYLQVPEMKMPVNELHLPAFNLEAAYNTGKAYSHIPYVLIVDVDTIKGNSNFGNLKEFGVFKMEKGGLKIVEDYFPMYESTGRGYGYDARVPSVVKYGRFDGPRISPSSYEDARVLYALSRPKTSYPSYTDGRIIGDFVYSPKTSGVVRADAEQEELVREYLSDFAPAGIVQSDYFPKDAYTQHYQHRDALDHGYGYAPKFLHG